MPMIIKTNSCTTVAISTKNAITFLALGNMKWRKLKKLRFGTRSSSVITFFRIYPEFEKFDWIFVRF